MIYQPQVYFNVEAAVGTGFLAAIGRASVDYIRGQGQPWTYYAGYGFGGAALATGIPGANAILYALGAGTVKLFFEKSPGAADVRIFLNGVAQADLSLDDEIIDTLEYLIDLDTGLERNVVQLLNLGTVSTEDPTDFLSILAIEATNVYLAQKEFVQMAVVIYSVQIRDAKTTSSARVKNTQSVAVYMPLGSLTLAEMTGYHDALLEAVDNTTDGVIIGSSINIQPDLPAGLKSAAVAGSDVQEGGLITFTLDGSQYTDSIRIPAFKSSLFGADGQTIANSGDTAALVSLLTGAVADPLDLAASDRNGIAFAAFSAAKKSFRK